MIYIFLKYSSYLVKLAFFFGARICICSPPWALRTRLRRRSVQHSNTHSGGAYNHIHTDKITAEGHGRRYGRHRQRSASPPPPLPHPCETHCSGPKSIRRSATAPLHYTALHCTGPSTGRTNGLVVGPSH
jgi:hypothetical protein